MEINTKIKLDEMTEEIKLLSTNFQKKDYPFETLEQKTERQKAIAEQGSWGIVTVSAGTGSIETVSYTHLTLPTNREV